MVTARKSRLSYVLSPTFDGWTWAFLRGNSHNNADLRKELPISLCQCKLESATDNLDVNCQIRLAVIEAGMARIVCTVSTSPVAAGTFAARDCLPLSDERCLIPAYR